MTAGFRRLRQQASAARSAGEVAASSGRASRRSASLKAWLGMRARFKAVVRASCGTSGLGACSPPWALRRLRESTRAPSGLRRDDRICAAVLFGERFGIECLARQRCGSEPTDLRRTAVATIASSGRAGGRSDAGPLRDGSPDTRPRRRPGRGHREGEAPAARTRAPLAARGAAPPPRAPVPRGRAASRRPHLRRRLLWQAPREPGMSSGRTSMPSIR